MELRPDRLRLFIDETSCLDNKTFGDDRDRYLSLTGVIVRTRLLKAEIEPAFNALRKTHFGHSESNPVILHRTSIRAGKGSFAPIKDPIKRASWGRDVLDFLRLTRFGVITICIDKKELSERQWSRKRDPYHLAMVTMLERYFLCLQKQGTFGDVIAESRTPQEDNRVREAFREFRASKSWYIQPAEIQKRISCHKIKILPKKKDVIGLQIADLIAAPSLYHCFNFYKGRPFPSEFSRSVADILESAKYLRNPRSHNIEGHGRLWRPK